MRTPYSRSTKGFNSEVFVLKDVYSAAANLAGLAAAAVGEAALYDSTGVLLSAAFTTKDGFHVAQKTKEGVRTSALIKSSQVVEVRKMDYVAGTARKCTLNFTGITVAKGDVIDLTVQETTIHTTPFPTWAYSVEVKAGQTLAQTLAALVAEINSVNNPANQGNQIVSAIANGDTIELTAVDAIRQFNAVGYVGDSYAAATYTAGVFPIGTPAQVRDLEEEGHVYAGYRSKYNENGDAFGKPESFVDEAGTYALYLIEVRTSEHGVAPVSENVNRKFITIAAKKSAGVTGNEMETKLDTVLGVA
jgi:hypothetical protein